MESEKSKVKKQFILVNNQLNLSIPAETFIRWITWYRKRPATRGLEFKQPRIRKREQRKKLKERRIKNATVTMIRSELKTQHSTDPQALLFTLCPKCRKDCWYKGDGLYKLPWLLCFVYQTNWANGGYEQRIPYECRICKFKR
ncbi:hypothetical protein TSAR_012894 [Trichomalopsis sarcophagae]|uniref:Uncharacterized protein n=1 Tax=Trichomalopsis sarcophagae TaxID=543379 RepID=A0A232F334_9HYME|nr:hypothetical protein TSAR_012894 [Trichomalopsis sarcophagae]